MESEVVSTSMVKNALYCMGCGLTMLNHPKADKMFTSTDEVEILINMEVLNRNGFKPGTIAKTQVRSTAIQRGTVKKHFQKMQ